MSDFMLGFLIAVFGILTLWLEGPLWVLIPAVVTALVGMTLMLSAVDE